MRQLLRSRRLWLMFITYGLGLSILLAVCGQLLLMFIFDENRIQNAINRNLQQTDLIFTFQGRVHRSWFPSPNFELRQVEVRQKSGRPLLQTRYMNVRFSYGILLGNTQIKRISLEEASVHFVRYAKQRYNIDFLVNPDNAFKKPQELFFKNVEWHWADQVSQKRYRAHSSQAFITHIQQNPHINAYLTFPRTEQKLPVDTHWQFTWHQDSKTFQDLSGSLKVFFPQMGNITAHWHAPQMAYQDGLWEIQDWQCDGESDQQISFNTRIQQAAFSLRQPIFKASQITHIAHWANQKNTLYGNLSLQELNLTPDSVSANPLTLQIKQTNNDLVRTADMKSHVHVQNRAIVFDDLQTHTLQTTTGKTHSQWQTDLNGRLLMDNAGFRWQAEGFFDKQPFSLKIHYDDDTHQWQNQLHWQKWNITPYFNQLAQTDDSWATLNQIMDTIQQGMKHLPDHSLQTQVSIDDLQLDGMKTEKLNGQIDLSSQELAWHNAKGNMHDGQAWGNFRVQFGKERQYDISQTVQNIDVGEWMLHWTGRPYVTGKGNIHVQLSFSGNTPDAMKQSIRGTTSTDVQQGTIYGLDLLSLIHSVLEEKNSKNIIFNHQQKTDFQKFSIHSQWENGVAHTKQMDFLGKDWRLTGKGELHIAPRTLDYRFMIEHGNSILPLHVSGQPEQLNYSIDYSNIAQRLKNPEERQKAVKEALKEPWKILP